MPDKLSSEWKPKLRHRIEWKANRILHRLLTVQCKLYRHPDKRYSYSDGRSNVRCPCGRINFYERTFRA